MRLRYKAATKEGKLSQGLLDAKDIQEAAVYLRAKGLMPIQIVRIDNQILTQIPFLNKVKTADLILFTRQMSSMLSAGLTLMKSLEILKDQMTNITNIIIIIITAPIKVMTIIGYINAPRIVDLSFACFSKLSANLAKTLSNKPDASPAFIMEI